MSDPKEILTLYFSVLIGDIEKHNVDTSDIRVGIQNMKEMYMPRVNSLSSMTSYVVDYDDVAHRCAYLHKYAPLHTAMVSDLLWRALISNSNVLSYFYIASNSSFKLCSLGAGPGTDVIGVMQAMHSKFGFVSFSATLVDCKALWKDTFSSLTDELRSGKYGTLGINFSPQYLDWKYLGNNLLGKMNGEVNQAIGSADLVTMVKFLSAAACVDTEAMIKKIFNVMKPGAMVLYIDNAAGGFRQLVTKAAKECHLVSVFGPLHHEHYVNEAFNVKLFGYTSCYQTKVTVHLLQKDIRAQRINGHITPSNVLADKTYLTSPNHNGIFPNHNLPESFLKLKSATPNTVNATTIKSFAANPETSKCGPPKVGPMNEISNHKITAAKSLTQNESRTISNQKDIGHEDLDKRRTSDSEITRSCPKQATTIKSKVYAPVDIKKFPGVAPQARNMFKKCTRANFPSSSIRVTTYDQRSRMIDPAVKTKQPARILIARNPTSLIADYDSSWNTTETMSKNSRLTTPHVSTQRNDVARYSLQDMQERNCCRCVIM